MYLQSVNPKNNLANFSQARDFSLLQKVSIAKFKWRIIKKSFVVTVFIILNDRTKIFQPLRWIRSLIILNLI